jgi:hypothetical protein
MWAKPREFKEWSDVMRLAANPEADVHRFRAAVQRSATRGELNLRDNNQQTALILAVRAGWEHDDTLAIQLDKIDYLVTRGVNAYLPDADNETALSLAAAKGWHGATIRMLTASSTRVRARRDGWAGWAGLVAHDMILAAMRGAPLHVERPARRLRH